MSSPFSSVNVIGKFNQDIVGNKMFEYEHNNLKLVQ